jgi:hypothetical protein
VQRPEWAPADVDMDSPSPARVYDALLGGSHNFEIDRAAARRATGDVPDLPLTLKANRRFLRRAVTYLVSRGVRQFVDLGAGIPTVGNTHEVAQELDPECRVAYVDIDAVAVAHAAAILAGNDRAVAIRADLRMPAALLENRQLTDLIDLDQPVGLLFVAALHLLRDDDRPGEALAALRDRTVAGSYVVISHLTSTHRPDDAHILSEQAQRQDRVSLIFRPREQIEGFFAGYELEPPGLVEVSQWRPDLTGDDDGTPPGQLILAGVGRKN